MFAKLYDSKIGKQVLFTIDSDSDGNSGIKITSQTADGGMFSIHLGIDEEDIDEAFTKVDQQMADGFAEQYCTKTSLQMIGL